MEWPEANERRLLPAILRWVGWHHPGLFARIETAVPDPLLDRLWHVKAQLSDGNVAQFLLFERSEEPSICLRIDDLR